MKEPLTRKSETNFTMVANRVIYDPLLSFKAKGLFTYLYSKPDRWAFSADRMAGESSDGVDAVLAGLRELENEGYLQRKKKSDGRVEYFVTYKPKRENPFQVKAHSGKIPSLSNTISESNTKKEEDATQSVAAPIEIKPANADSFFSKKAKDDFAMMDCKGFVLMCRGSRHRHIRLIGEYADEREFGYTTRGQWREFGMRNMRPATRLKPFTDKQISDAIARLHADFSSIERKSGVRPKWGMETIEKYLEEANAKI